MILIVSLKLFKLVHSWLILFHDHRATVLTLLFYFLSISFSLVRGARTRRGKCWALRVIIIRGNFIDKWGREREGAIGSDAINYNKARNWDHLKIINLLPAIISDCCADKRDALSSGPRICCWLYGWRIQLQWTKRVLFIRPFQDSNGILFTKTISSSAR